MKKEIRLRGKKDKKFFFFKDEGKTGFNFIKKKKKQKTQVEVLCTADN